MTVVTSEHRSFGRQVLYLARRALTMEIGVWVSLYRWVFRRPQVPRAAEAFTYHKQLTQILLVFIILSAIEIPIVDLIVHRWLFIRIPLLILGIWGMTWMLGFLFGFLTRPHAVGPEGISVRSGAEVTVDLPWGAIESVAIARHKRESSKSVQVSEEDGSLTLGLPVQGETNIEIVLERAVEAKLPQGTWLVHRVRLFADEPRDLLESVGRFLRQFEESPSNT